MLSLPPSPASQDYRGGRGDGKGSASPLRSDQDDKASNLQEQCGRVCLTLLHKQHNSSALSQCEASCRFSPLDEVEIDKDPLATVRGARRTPTGKIGLTTLAGGSRKLLSWVEVERRSLQSSAAAMKNALRPGVALCAVIKGNAYGHDLVGAALELEQAGVDYLAVDTLEEALLLRASNVSVPILLLYWSSPWLAPLMASKAIEPSFWDLGWLAAAAIALDAHGQERKGRYRAGVLSVHLSVDTGLGREGCMLEEALELVHAIHSLALAGISITMRGLATHFCCARDGEMTRRQFGSMLALQREVARRYGKQGVHPLLHTSSGGPAIMLPETQVEGKGWKVASYSFLASRETW
eukprot:753491-Hanusia_phi.AAC.7